MNIHQLVTMANDIAAFFHGTTDQNDSARSVATHLRLYWEPRMRNQLLAHMQTGGEGLSDVARAGVELLAQG